MAGPVTCAVHLKGRGREEEERRKRGGREKEERRKRGEERSSFSTHDFLNPYTPSSHPLTHPPTHPHTHPPTPQTLS